MINTLSRNKQFLAGTVSTIVLGFITWMILYTPDIDKKISSPNSHIVLDRICGDIDSTTCNQLRFKYKLLNIVKENEVKGAAYFQVYYGIRYEDLTFRDLIESKD